MVKFQIAFLYLSIAIATAIPVSFASGVQSKTKTQCLAFYSYVNENSAVYISEEIKKLIKAKPYDNHSLLVFDFLENHFSGIVSSHMELIRSLHKTGTDNKVASAAKLNETLIATLSTKIKEIESLIEKNALHSEKAKGITEALKTCANSMGECQIRLRTAVEELQETIQLVTALSSKIKYITSQLPLLNGRISGEVINQRLAQFNIMASTLNSFHEVMKQQIEVGVSQLAFYPTAKHQLLELEVRGVNLGEFERQNLEQQKIEKTSDRKKSSTNEEFSRASEFKDLLAKFPVSTPFEISLRQLKQLPPTELLANFDGNLHDFYREALDLPNFVTFEDIKIDYAYDQHHILFNWNNLKGEWRKGFSLAEVKILIDLALENYSEKGFQSTRDGKFMYVNSERSRFDVLYGQSQNFSFADRISSATLDKGVGGLLWSLLARLRHPLSKKELDLFVAHFEYKAKSIVHHLEAEKETDIKEIKEKYQKLKSILDGEWSAKQASFRIYTRRSKKNNEEYLYTTKRNDLDRNESREIDSLTSHDYSKFSKLHALKNTLNNIHEKKDFFFSHLVRASLFKDSIYTNGKIGYKFTVPDLKDDDVQD
jgi:hypothetical protein